MGFGVMRQSIVNGIEVSRVLELRKGCQGGGVTGAICVVTSGLSGMKG